MPYVAPKRINPGARVAIVAPASPIRTDELVAGLDIIRECGLEPVLGKCVRTLNTVDIHAAPLMDRVEELMWAFTEPGIEGIYTCLGGMGSGELLPYLDYGAIRQSQRPLIGLSDITALNNGILAGAGLISINGQYPAIRVDEGAYLRNTDEESLRFATQFMMSPELWEQKPFTINQYLPRTVSPGKARGHVIGGNLDTFCTLIGSPFMPECEGAILFVEDVHKGGTEIARLLIHCKLAGVLDKVAGIVVGEFCDVPKCREPHEPSVDDVIHQYMSDGPPCLYGASFSHGPWTIPIPIGASCQIDADSGVVSFDFAMG